MPPRPDLEIAVRAFTSREDLAILAFLARVESAMAPEICDELRMALNTVHRHLGMLESLGLVLVDTPAGGSVDTWWTPSCAMACILMRQLATYEWCLLRVWLETPCA